MITEDVRSRIRRLFFAEHWKLGTIAAELGLHHDTVELAVEPRRFVNRRHASSVTELAPYRDSPRPPLRAAGGSRAGQNPHRQCATARTGLAPLGARSQAAPR